MVKYLFSRPSPHSPHFLQKFTAFTAFHTKIYPKTLTRDQETILVKIDQSLRSLAILTNIEVLVRSVQKFAIYYRSFLAASRVDLSWQPYPRAIYGSIHAIQNFRCMILPWLPSFLYNFFSRFSDSMEGKVLAYKVDRVNPKQNIFGLYGSCMASRKSCMASKKTCMASRSGSCMASKKSCMATKNSCMASTKPSITSRKAF